MAITYDLLEPQSDLNASLETLTQVFAPLYTDCWVQDKAKSRGNPPFDMNVNVFAQMWFSKAMRIFMAYDNGAPVGYLMGMAFRPLTHQASIFQIEDWYAKNHDSVITSGLFDYMQTALRFMGVDELWVSHNANDLVPPLQNIWKPRGATIIDRYVK